MLKDAKYTFVDTFIVVLEETDATVNADRRFQDRLPKPSVVIQLFELPPDIFTYLVTAVNLR